MILTLRPLDEPAARAVIGWRYEAPYDVYNMDPTRAEEDVKYLTDPANNLHGIYDESDELVGFGSFGRDARVPGGDYSSDAVDIGLGVRPDLTGMGLGATFASTMIAHAREVEGATSYRVTIASFNTRAQRVWSRVGFREIQRFRRPSDEMGFVVMQCNDSPGETAASPV